MTFSIKKHLLHTLILLISLTTILSNCSSDASKIFKENSKAVVVIMTYDNKGNPLMQGSGFIVRKDGAIVTVTVLGVRS